MLILENLSLWMSVNEILTAHKQTASSPVSFELCQRHVAMIEPCGIHIFPTPYFLYLCPCFCTQINRFFAQKRSIDAAFKAMSLRRIW